MVPMDLKSRWKMVIKTKEIGNVERNLLNSHKKSVSDEDVEQIELIYCPVAQRNCRNNETHCMIRAMWNKPYYYGERHLSRQ